METVGAHPPGKRQLFPRFVTRMMKEEVKLKETPSVLQRGLCGPDI
jgi:hypothetical protein